MVSYELNPLFNLATTEFPPIIKPRDDSYTSILLFLIKPLKLNCSIVIYDLNLFSEKPETIRMFLQIRDKIYNN